MFLKKYLKKVHEKNVEKSKNIFEKIQKSIFQKIHFLQKSVFLDTFLYSLSWKIFFLIQVLENKYF